MRIDNFLKLKCNLFAMHNIAMFMIRNAFYYTKNRSKKQVCFSAFENFFDFSNEKNQSTQNV